MDVRKSAQTELVWYNSCMNKNRFHPFKREDHVYKSDAFEELVKDAVQFFYKTPVVALPPPERFEGSGVYAIYCTSRTGIYSVYGQQLNRLKIDIPIYVGSAMASGRRQARAFVEGASHRLQDRLAQHTHSIAAANNLKVEDFCCRFMILDGKSDSMATAIESFLIALDNPLWNGVIDGFGNHTPGKRRLDGDRPAWDVLHPGRSWAKEMPIRGVTQQSLMKRVTDYLYGKVNRRESI